MRASIASAVVLSVAMAGCGGGGETGDRLAWCSAHQAEVARAALAAGLMKRGQRYEDWKFSDGEYRTACDAAWNDPGR